MPVPSPGDLPNPGIELMYPTWQADSLLLSHLGSPKVRIISSIKILRGLSKFSRFPVLVTWWPICICLRKSHWFNKYFQHLLCSRDYSRYQSCSNKPKKRCFRNWCHYVLSLKIINLLISTFLNSWNWSKYGINTIMTQTQGNVF